MGRDIFPRRCAGTALKTQQCNNRSGDSVLVILIIGVGDRAARFAHDNCPFSCLVIRFSFYLPEKDATMQHDTEMQHLCHYLKDLSITLRCCIISRHCIICRIWSAMSLPYLCKIGFQVATRCGIIRYPNSACLNPKTFEHPSEFCGRTAGDWVAPALLRLSAIISQYFTRGAVAAPPSRTRTRVRARKRCV